MKILTIGGRGRDAEKLRRALAMWGESDRFEHRTNLKKALELLGEQPFDLIFIDLHPSKQPLFDRLAALRAVALDATIVAVTPPGSETWGKEVLRAGADDFIEYAEFKPVIVARLIRYALERKQMFNECLKASAEAKRSSQVKSAFMANMSHEIRTPLNLIVGAADLLNETDLNPQQKRLLKTFTNASVHLLSLLNDVLDLSQLDAQGLRCLDAGFDLRKVFFEVSEIISVLCRAKKLNFDYYLDANIPNECVGDSVRIRQVLLNLLKNAVKFTKHGSVQVRLDITELSGAACNLRLKVKDTGIGIAKTELGRVFESFYQADTGLERQYHGSGLGLSIVKAIVDHYGGDVQIESEPGVGTEVTVNLKFSLEAKNSPFSFPHLKNMRFMIVTHGPLEAQSISHQLQRLGATTVWFSSGQAALSRLKSDAKFDHVLLDLQTQDQGAFQLVGRSDFPFPKERVIALLPPLHRRGDLQECGRLGILKYLYKPFSLPQFLVYVRDSLEHSEIALPQPARQSLNVLVVDDDFDTRELMVAHLARTPHQVSFAKDGPEAIAMVEKAAYDLILMDIEMPGLSGYDTTRLLRELPNGKACKIVGLSANAFPENIAEARKIGFSGYLTKPIRKERLLSSLLECMRTDKFYEAVPSTLADSA